MRTTSLSMRRSVFHRQLSAHPAAFSAAWLFATSGFYTNASADSARNRSWPFFLRSEISQCIVCTVGGATSGMCSRMSKIMTRLETFLSNLWNCKRKYRCQAWPPTTERSRTAIMWTIADTQKIAISASTATLWKMCTTARLFPQPKTAWTAWCGTKLSSRTNSSMGTDQKYIIPKIAMSVLMFGSQKVALAVLIVLAAWICVRKATTFLMSHARRKITRRK